MSSQPFDFEKFRVDQAPEAAEVPADAGFDFGKFRIDPVQAPGDEEGLGSAILRNIARAGVTSAAALGAVPGQLVGAIKAGAEALPQAPEFLQRDPTFLERGAKAALEALPTQEQLLEIPKKVAQTFGAEGFFDPKGEMEEFADEVVSDFAVLAVGSPGLMRPLITAAGSNLIGTGVEKVTESKTKGAMAKAGAMFLGSFMGRPSVKEFNKKQFAEVDRMIEDGLHIRSFELAKDLEKAKKGIQLGGEVADDAKILGILNPILEKAGDGSIMAKEIIAARRKLGDLKLSARGFGRTKVVKEALDDTLKLVDDIRPGFSQLHRSANEGLKAIREAEQSISQLSGFVGGKKFSPATLAVLGAINPKFAAGALAAKRVIPSIANTQAVLTNPALHPYVKALVKASAADNIKAMQRAIVNIDKVVQKEKIDLGS